ncbi:MAG: TIM barrel protein [Chloroflexi bacterium]|nr:TIM barrel protein [Chloroflexota bacterium]
MSRVSVCSIALRHLEAEAAFRVIAEAGFKKVDLLQRPPHFSLDPAECDPEKVAKAARTYGLQIANLGTYTGAGFESENPAEQEAALKLMYRAIDLAVFFGARSIRVRAGNDDPACIERIVPWFKQSADYAAAHRVYMGIENHGGAISGNPEVLTSLFGKVGSPYFGDLYEPYNLMSAGTEYHYALGVMRKHIVHAHFKLGKGKPGAMQLTMPEENEIDYPWVLSTLDKLGYTGDFALEYEYKGEPAETALPKWYEAFKAL